MNYEILGHDDISEFKWHGTAYLLQNTLSKYINSADYMGDMYFLDIPKKAFRFVCNERQFSGRGNLLYGKNAAEEYAQGKLEVFTGEIHGFTENGNRRMEAMALYFVHDVIGIGRK